MQQETVYRPWTLYSVSKNKLLYMTSSW